MSKQEILDAIWPEQFISESALTACISELRQVFGDTGRASTVLENIPKRGYRLLTPVVWATEVPVATRTSDEKISVSPSEQPSNVRRGPVVAAALATLIVGIAAIAGWRLIASRIPPARRTPIRSVAVLPLSNLTGDSQQDYFVDGLTEQLRSELARIPSLEVISGTSASRYKHRTESAPEIAKQLGQVDGLIEGGIARSGDRVRVMIDLVDARTDTQTWARTYDGQLRDILSLYSDITRAVAAEITSNASGKETQAAVTRRTVQPEAYDRFLQALYFSHRWQAGGCVKAEALLREAVKLDPTFAEAYTELAYCYTFPDMLKRPASEIVPAAHQAIARALELDDRAGMAHSVLGFIKYHQDFDWVAAAQEFQHGLELNPGDAYTNFLYGELLYSSGHTQQGVALLRAGLRLDPFSLDMKDAYGLALRLVGRPQDAVDEFQQVLSDDSSWMGARFSLSAAYADMGRRDEAVSESLAFLRHVLVPERANSVADSLGETYAKSGWRAFLQREIDVATEGRDHSGALWQAPYDRFCSAYWMAWRYARLGNRDRAMAELERAYRERDHHITFLDVEPDFRDLRSDPRFQDLRRRVGLALN